MTAVGHKAADDHPTVQPGQIWSHGDPSVSDRRLRVTDVDIRYAYCESWYEDSSRPTRSTRILLRSFRPTASGYWLVQDAPDGGMASDGQ